MDDKHRHAAMISTRGQAGKAGEATQVSSFKESMQLNDPSFLVNSVSTRHIQPNGAGSFDFVWTHFGFENDDEEMTQRRLRQANRFGQAGFMSGRRRRGDRVFPAGLREQAVSPDPGGTGRA